MHLKDPIGMAKAKVSLEKLRKQSKPQGGVFQAAPRKQLLKKNESGEAYMSSLKSGTVKTPKVGSLPNGPFANKKQRSFSTKKPNSPGVAGRRTPKFIVTLKGGSNY